MTIIINTNKIKMPYSKARGSEAQRFEKAEALCKQFVDSLKSEYAVSGSITSRKLASILNKTATPVKIFPELIKEYLPRQVRKVFTNTGYSFGEDGVAQKHILFIKKIGAGIQKSDSIPLIKTVQFIFSKIYNPKVIKRELSLFGGNIVNNLSDFQDKLLLKSDITEKDLEGLLKRLKPEKKINILQVLRYRLKLAMGIQKSGLYATPMDKSTKMEITPYESFKYDAKMKLLNKKLLEVIQEQRVKIQKSNEIKRRNKTKSP